MLKIDGITYNGYIMTEDDDRLIIAVESNDDFSTFMGKFLNTTAVIDFAPDGTERVHYVKVPKMAKIISDRVYSVEFSKKPTRNDRIEQQLQEQSDAIDSLLVMLLEG